MNDCQGRYFSKISSNLIYGTMYFIQDSVGTILLKTRLKNLSVPYLIFSLTFIVQVIHLICPNVVRRHMGHVVDRVPSQGLCLSKALPGQTRVWAPRSGQQVILYYCLSKVDFILNDKKARQDNDKITSLLGCLQLQSA